jgi:hypothetical protein
VAVLFLCNLGKQAYRLLLWTKLIGIFLHVSTDVYPVFSVSLWTRSLMVRMHMLIVCSTILGSFESLIYGRKISAYKLRGIFLFWGCTWIIRAIFFHSRIHSLAFCRRYVHKDQSLRFQQRQRQIRRQPLYKKYRLYADLIHL